ncbi:MAG: zinc ribbon domain-containing protein [Mycobacteriaceae bacterium]
MKAEPEVQRALLDLAAVDAELLRIGHRRTTLPEQQALSDLEQQRQSRKDSAVAAQIALDDLDRDITKLEGEVSAVRQREDRDRHLLESGNAPAKQLSELQHELATLERRQIILEDDLLEVMERREATAADYEHAGAQLSQVDEEIIDATRLRDDALADLVTAEERCVSDRKLLIERFPADLLATYERQRAATGIGAGLLQARRCGACRMELDRGVLTRIAAADPSEVLRCEECGAILVRTKESGL